MNRSRVLLPAAAGAVLLGIGVYLSGGGLGGDASAAGCGGGEVVDVQQDVGEKDSALDAEIKALAAWDAARLAADRPTFDAKLALVVDAGPSALPSIVEVIQNQGCNEPTSGPLVQGLRDILVNTTVPVDGVDGIAQVLVVAATQGLTEFEAPAADAPSFSAYKEFDELAARLRGSNSADVPEMKQWTDEPGRWAELAGDDEVASCSVAALNATISLQDPAALDHLLAAVDNLPEAHPSAQYLVGAAMQLSNKRPDSAIDFQAIALDTSIYDGARVLACTVARFDEPTIKEASPKLMAMTPAQIGPMVEPCDLGTVAPDIVYHQAQRFEETHGLFEMTGRKIATRMRTNEATLDELWDEVITGPKDAPEACNTTGIICGYGQLIVSTRAVIQLVSENEEERAALRSKLEAAIAEATPEEMSRLTVLAHAAEDLWPTRVPGLEY